MVTLYTFGPGFGLPDPSPFVMKAELLLKFANLPFTTDSKGFGRAPKGKLPYIADDGQTIADSTFIRFHIERKYGFDFDAGLSEEQKSIAWAVEKMCEDHLYWAVVDARWMDDANFARGPAAFFKRVSAPVRPVVKRIVRRNVKKSAIGHGMGKHSRAEIETLAARDLAAIAGVLGGKPYLMGDTPCGADAAVFGEVASCLCPVFETKVREAAESHPNLTAYRDRILARYFPGFNG